MSGPASTTDDASRDFLVDIDAIPMAPFNDGNAGVWKRLSLRINRRRFVRGKRFWARTICRIFPQISKTQYDVKSVLGIRARIALDNAHDYWVIEQDDALEADYRQCLRRALAEHVGSDGFVYVDIGGNTGIVAALTLSELNGYASVAPSKVECVVVEPQDDLIARLATNLKWNAGAASVQLFHCALGDRFDTISMSINYNNRGGSSVAERSFFSRPTKMAPLTHIVGAAGLKKIDLLKIDVEGFEFKILQPFFRDCQKSMLPKFIFTEIKSDRHGDLKNLLSDAAYERLWFNDEDAFFRLRSA